MPLSRPGPDPAPLPTVPFTIPRAELAGMTPGEAHEAVLGAFDAGVIAATSAAGMADQGIIDAKVAELAAARKIAAAHAPFSLVSNDPERPAPEGVWCMAHNDDPRSTWPCPTYRDAAATIADGLAAVVTA
jgi:hypothetical protein